MFSILAFLSIGTEFSTIFVGLRWLLHFHKKIDGALYFYNGCMMTASFFLVRVVFMSYIIFGLCLPKFSKFDDSKDPEHVRILAYISVTFYVILFGLNLFWFKKMAKGALKHLKKSEAGDSASASKKD